MGLQAFCAGCNIVAIEKNNKRYGMCCAWAQMIDYDKISLLLGGQSVTGNILSIGDVVGVSALDKDQKPLAKLLGSGHSDKIDKFKNINIIVKEGAILIPGAKVRMKCKVSEVLELPGLKSDHFVILDVLEYWQDENKIFLSAYEV
jgi:flavin reductase (DIM6/NTAB) family NADH-FMN oxidoreductase RutF